MLINLIHYGSNENCLFDISDVNNLKVFIYSHILKNKTEQECKNVNYLVNCFNTKCEIDRCIDDCPSCPSTQNSKNIINFLDFKKNEKLVQYYTFSRIQPTNDPSFLTSSLTGGVFIQSHIFYTNQANILLVMVSGRDENITTICHKFDTLLTPDNLRDIRFFNDLANNGSNELVQLKYYIQKSCGFSTNSEYIVQKDGLPFTQLVNLVSTIIQSSTLSSISSSSTSSSSKKFVRNK